MPDDVIERVLALADGPVEQVRHRLSDVDAAPLARCALDELLFRAALIDAPERPVTVQIDLGGGGRCLGFAVTMGPEGDEVRSGRADDPDVHFRQDLAEFLAGLFGPPGLRADATREVSLVEAPLPEAAGGRPDHGRHEAARRAAHRLLKASSPDERDLDSLAVRFGSDKWCSHWYTPRYRRHFAEYREQRVRLLEIGVGGFHDPHSGGESLRMWKHYFRRGLVYGLDLYDKSGVEQPRIRTVRGDQSDGAFLDSLAAGIGPLDIVVDDGSHLSEHVIASFRALFPHVRPGGLYVVEDLQTSYWTGWNGDNTDPGAPGTAIRYLKDLVDGLHHQDRPDGPDGKAPAAETAGLERQIAAVHFYHNIVFIEKSVNADQPAPSWLPRETDPREWTRSLPA
ncbi:class I SAM-dependent methyltransferase [Spirillospora sp. NPDC029432]|uniref:class I SAM-dependent methyltransferase n=1 Tax=Spirillospora sp. NPDC029432 TaxID=3154599 RepID=UPI0034545A9F